MEHDRQSETSVLRDAFDVLHEWLEARPQRFHKEQILPLGQLQQVAQLGRVRRRRLLAEDVLAV